MDFLCAAPGVTGETNTVERELPGVGVYHSKSGVQLRFKKINAATNGRPSNRRYNQYEIDIGLQGGTDAIPKDCRNHAEIWHTLTSQYDA